MKSKITKTILATVLSVGIFSAGSYAEANNNWFSQLTVDGMKEIGKAAFDKKNELLDNFDTNVEKKAKEKLQVKVDEGKVEAVTQLDDYFNEKLSVIEELDGFKTAEETLQAQVDTVVTNYKAEIDKKFAEVFGN